MRIFFQLLSIIPLFFCLVFLVLSAVLLTIVFILNPSVETTQLVRRTGEAFRAMHLRLETARIKNVWRRQRRDHMRA